MATYGGISKKYIIQIRFYLFFCFTDKVRGTKNEQSDVDTYGRIIHVYINFAGTLIWLMYHLLTADNRPGFQRNVNTYGGISNIYLLHLWIWLIYCLIDIHDGRAQPQVSSKWQLLFIYYFQINMSQICTFWTEIQVYYLTRLVWRNRITFRFFSYVSIFQLIWRREDVGICWNQLNLGFPC